MFPLQPSDAAISAPTDRAVGVRNEQTACVMGEQSLHVVEMVGHGGVPAASLLP